ncbi:hypothetical protein GCM10022239_15540 [Leifsonia bigeumensis]|uniref:HNH nuclease domain-containing protein n=1 Tax=Leifsonella bigeumensis TaxID=433643 RepID=A0ABP7FJL7_9MICO
MATTADMFVASLDAALSANALVASAASAARGLGDTGLLDAQRAIAEARRHLDACASVLAGEVVRRSQPEAGLSGLARKEGFRTPAALIRHTTGSSTREAVTLVRVGTMLNDVDLADAAESADGVGNAESTDLAEPWLVSVGAAVAAGTLSAASAEAIRAGLGEPGPGVSVDALTDAARRIVDAGSGADTDRLLRMARDARDGLDALGIAERERARRERRSFRRWKQPDGMTRYTWELDPEGAALIDGIYDQITSPRRGGPRFVDEGEQARAEAILNDSRTTEQLASDSFLGLLTLAMDADVSHIVGRATPAVRVLVSGTALSTRRGSGRLEGQADPISLETVERIVCTSGTVPIVFDDNGQAIDVGREQRLFTPRQRIALAARDGGCRWPGCERPPAWTEAHHVRHWKRDHGPTDLENGILLCRHHHMLLHDNHWEIRVSEGDYWLIPPPDLALSQQPQLMPSRSAALRDLLAERAS